MVRREPATGSRATPNAVKTNLTRLRGRAPRGTRLEMDAPFGSWGTQTLIAGLTQDALIAPWVIKGAMDGPAFATYIREVLIPEIEPGTIVRPTHSDRWRSGPHSGQSCHPSKQAGDRGLARSWLLVSLPAALFPRSQPH